MNSAEMIHRLDGILVAQTNQDIVLLMNRSCLPEQKFLPFEHKINILQLVK